MKSSSCSNCGQVKPNTEYRGKNRQCNACLREKNKKYKVNREKRNAWEREYWAKNPEKRREKRLKQAFGLSLEEYHDLLIDQGGCCSICKEPCSSGSALAVDHCHKTNLVRGLLCRNCNVGLGNFRDSPQLLRSAATYVERTDEKGLYIRPRGRQPP